MMGKKVKATVRVPVFVKNVAGCSRVFTIFKHHASGLDEGQSKALNVLRYDRETEDEKRHTARLHCLVPGQLILVIEDRADLAMWKKMLTPGESDFAKRNRHKAQNCFHQSR